MDTFLLILVIGFFGVMLYLLPKYAKFINEMPKKHMENMKERADRNTTGGNPPQSGDDTEK